MNNNDICYRCICIKMNLAAGTGGDDEDDDAAALNTEVVVIDKTCSITYYEGKCNC